MAFKNKNMSVMAYANGFTLWHYRADENETLLDVMSADYFQTVRILMNTGDMMYVNSNDAVAQIAIIVDDKTVTTKTMCSTEYKI